MTEPNLGERELEVLKIIWEREPCPVQEVVEIMSRRRGSARTTILTLIQRLHAKGYLKRKKRFGLYHYATTRQRHTVMAGAVRRFVNTVLDGSPAPFLAYLCNSGQLTEEQLDTLREIAATLDGKKRKEKP